jgi:SAM-dependent methyltransferase
MEYYETFYYAGQAVGRGLTTKDSLESAFAERAVHYDEILGNFLPADRELRCLDLACGFGNWLYFLRSKGFRNAIGVDTDPEQIKLAKLLDLPAVERDAREALERPDYYGMISAIDLLEHLDKNDAVRLLQAVFRSLIVNGVLIMQMPCADGFRGAHDACNDLTHRWAASSNMLHQLLVTVGFSRVEVIDPSLPKFPRTFKSRAKRAIRLCSRKMLSLPLRAAGVTMPAIWADSQIAIAWK